METQTMAQKEANMQNRAGGSRRTARILGERFSAAEVLEDESDDEVYEPLNRIQPMRSPAPEPPSAPPVDSETESEESEGSEKQFGRGFGRGGGQRGRGRGRGCGRGRERGRGRGRGRGDQVAPNDLVVEELVIENSDSSENDDSSSKEEDVPGDIIRLKDGTDFVEWTKMEGHTANLFVQ